MFLSAMLRRDARGIVLVNRRTGAVLATRVEGAFDSKSRRKGLLGRDGLPRGTALAIAPCSSIHMFFMRFAIDAIFVRKDGTVVKVVRDLRPWRIALALRAYAVVEMRSGGAGDTRRGDQLELVPATAEGG